MMPSRRRLLAAAALAPALVLPGPARAAGRAPLVDTPDPGPRDTCPVCGMFVARYPEWIATVVWRDGAAAHFDGAKDCYKYLLDLPRYAPGRSAADIAAIGVTEYYALARIDARRARYVVGSDVLGPMGHELVPLADDDDAAAFLSDHAGVAVARHGEVTPALLAALDAGRFEALGQG